MENSLPPPNPPSLSLSIYLLKQHKKGKKKIPYVSVTTESMPIFCKNPIHLYLDSVLLSCLFFQVLFIHQYSGNMILDSAIPITLSYFTGTVCMIYAQYLTQGVPGPKLDLKVAGEVLFLVGIAGNFYHHYLLSKLREKGDKTYKIPKGGLFGLVICPHYLFEIIIFIGFCLISQTLYSFLFALGTLWYLMGRSYATRRWYLSKFENFPRQVKALIPYVF